MKRLYRLMAALFLVPTLLLLMPNVLGVSAAPDADPAPLWVLVKDSDPMDTYTINLTISGLAEFSGKPDAPPIGYCILRAFQVAIADVWNGEPPLREDIIVNTTNPTSRCFDAIDFLTKARTRRGLILKEIPGTTGIAMTIDNWIWVFVRESTGEAIEIKVKESAFPIVNNKSIIEYRAIVMGKYKAGETPTEEELADYQLAMSEFKKRLKNWSDSGLFETRMFTWTEPEFDAEEFLVFYAQECKPEWDSLKGVEALYDSMVVTNAELQDTNDELTTENKSLAAQLSEIEIQRYILLVTTVIFVLITAYLIIKNRAPR